MAFFGRSLAILLLSMVYLVQVAKAGDTPIYPLPTECPQNEDENSIVVHLPHESDCEKFYTCEHGNRTEQICPLRNDQGDRLHFNPVLQVCDWPESAGCQTANTPSPSPSTPSPSTPSPRPSTPSVQPGECPQNEDENSIVVHLPHESDCEKFYTCEHGNKTEQLCPLRNDQGDRLHFNPVLQVCDWPESAGCQSSGGGSSPNTPSSSPSTPSPSPSTPSPNTPSPSPNTPSPSPSTPSPKPSPQPGECPQHEDENSIVVHLPHESDCEKFYTCVHGEKVEQLCPVRNDQGDRLHFNPTLQVCDWPENAGCQNSTSTPNTPSPSPSTSSPSPSTPSPSPSTPSPSTPSPSTPSPSTPSPSTPSASTPSPTQNATTPSPSPSPTTPSPSTPIEENNRQNCTQGPVAHECECEKYYECLNGSLVLYQCPEGEWFDLNTTLCQVDWNAICEHKPTPPPPCTVCNEDTRYIGLPSRPNNYVWCNGTRPVLERCPSQLVFNQTARICDLAPRKFKFFY